MKKAYSIARTDRTGAQINEAIFAYAHCEKSNLEYVGPVGSCWFENHYKMSSFLNLPLPVRELSNEYSEYIKIKEEDYSREIYPNPNLLLDSSFIKKLRSKFFNKQKPLLKASTTAAIHIRRDDIKPGNTRYVPDQYFLDVITQIKYLSPLCEVSIYSDSDDFQNAKEFQRLGCSFKIKTSLEETWNDMILADILVMSKSSFSYVPAIYNNCFVIYYPAWYPKLDHWTSCDDPNIWDKLKKFLSIEYK